MSVNLNKINNKTVLDEILNKEIFIYEDVKGFKIYVKWNGDEFIILPETLTSEPINTEDFAIKSFYNKAINHLNSLDLRVKSLINKKWWYCFQYFNDDNPENIEYNRIPKNNLVLCSIIKNNKVDYTVEEIEEYSRLMNVECLPFIFKGKLGEKSIEAIKCFLSTSEDDLEYIFGEKNFAYFFYKLLNPQLSHTFLTDNFENDIEKIVLRVEEKETPFNILNPLYSKISSENYTEYAEIYSLILVNFLNFCQSVDLEKMKLQGLKKEEIYIFIICKLFNLYLNEVKDDISKFEFEIPEFFNKDKFRINKEIISNKLTRSYIGENPKFEYFFKCIIFSFNKKIKNPIGIINDNMIIIFNNFINSINKRIDTYLNKKSEDELSKNGLVSFDKFFDIKYSVDGDEKAYPDIQDEITKGEEKKKKKNGFDKSDLGKNIKK